jgi:tetratricopeptide (TPR) repeat protein
VLSKISNDKTVYLARGLVYQDMGNHSKAINDFTEAIRNDENMTEGYYYRGLSKISSKMYKDAIKDFDRAKFEDIRKMEEDPQYYKDENKGGISDGLGRCYHFLNDYEKALTHFDTAIEADHKNTTFLMHRAQCYFD